MLEQNHRSTDVKSVVACVKSVVACVKSVVAWVMPARPDSHSNDRLLSP